MVKRSVFCSSIFSQAMFGIIIIHGQKKSIYLFISLQSGKVWYNYTWSKEEYVFVHFSSVRQFR